MSTMKIVSFLSTATKKKDTTLAIDIYNTNQSRYVYDPHSHVQTADRAKVANSAWFMASLHSDVLKFYCNAECYLSGTSTARFVPLSSQLVKIPEGKTLIYSNM